MMLQWLDRELDLDFVENKVNVLVLENSMDYSGFLSSLMNASGNVDESFFLYEDDKKLNMTKTVEIAFSPILLDMNNKRIQTHLFHELKRISDETCYDLKEHANSVVVAYLDELLKKVPYPIRFNLELDENALYKQYDLHIDFGDENLLEKTIDYIQLQNMLCGVKLFVLVNCKAYFTPEQLQELYESVLYNKVNILMVENAESYCLSEEKYYIIDKDQCLITYN